MSKSSNVRRGLCAAQYSVFAAFALGACNDDVIINTPAPEDDTVAIRYTEYGIPHIRTNDYANVGFGQGYAQARDNLCEIERGMLAFDGQLSRHFGPAGEGSPMTSAQGNLGSDVYFRNLNESGLIEDLIAKPAPLGPRDEVREMVRGFVEGFNEFLAGPHALSCSGADWLRPMAELDVYRRAYSVTLLMGEGAFGAGGIVTAEPPSATDAGRLSSLEPRTSRSQGATLPNRLPGSNAIALGAEATSTGGGINVANPHIWWTGDMRWWQAQLTVPGQLDVSGAALIGMPLVVMGHTASVSWSITTAQQARRFTIFELTLAPDSPTTYLVDGVPEEMQRRSVSVDVQRPDGSLEIVTKDLWWTRFGPVVGDGSALPLPPWTASNEGEPGHAYVFADANSSNMRMLNTLFAFNHAKTSEDVLRAIRETQGVPWWTVVAADSNGQGLWSQIQVLPNVPDEHLERCSTDFGKAFFAAARFAVLDGSRGDCAWETDADALEPGIFGPGSLEDPTLPFALSQRYLENSNDSHWLPSADVRIDGMPRLLGDERSVRSLRTRGLIAELEAGVTTEPFTREAVQELVLSNHSYSADLVVDASVTLCRGLPGGTAQTSTGESVDVSAACAALAGWDRRMDTTSRGALLFSRYWTRVLDLAEASEQSPWVVPFDVEDPVHTPNTLDVSAPFVAQALADATAELDAAGIDVNSRLGDYQYITRGETRIAVSGGTEDVAVVNIQDSVFSPTGFTGPFYGSGYMHVVSLDGSACPDAVSLLTYSQSTEPTSPHYSDQTELYSQKKWVEGRFCEADILASPALEVIELKASKR